MIKWLSLLTWTLLVACTDSTENRLNVPLEAANRAPNVIIILADDLGYGDLGCYGSARAETPYLDRMAAEGAKLTNFYAFPSCSPSRAALLTGCYPARVGIPNVVGPPGPKWTADKQYGLHQDETTLAEILKSAGYATGIVGKWHLGHFPETMPLRHGFDEFFGLPYSNDMLPHKGYPDLNLYDGETVLESNPDQTQLTKRYTERAVDYIRNHRDTSFFLYLAHSMPHVPIYASESFAGMNADDPYADVIEELDASVGTILKELTDQGIDDKTLVIFTSDNGPWLSFGNHAGSAGPFREGKGTTFEGGMRVPMIAHWPGTIEPGIALPRPTSLMDVLPTVAAISNAALPENKIAGRDISALLTGRPASRDADDPIYYFKGPDVQAVRVGKWKLHVPHDYRTVAAVGGDAKRGKDGRGQTEMVLYNLATDQAERYDVAAANPEIVDRLTRRIAKMQGEMDAEARPPFRPAE